MRPLSTLIVVLSLISIACAAKGTPDNKLTKFTTRLQSKHSKFGIITLDDSLYDDIVNAPRNYTAIVLLTALEGRYGCQLCKDFQPQYELLAKTWYQDNKKTAGDGLLFSSLDFGTGKQTFSKLGLSTAPVLYLFPPTEGRYANLQHISDPIKFDFVLNHVPAEQVAQFIGQHTAYRPRVVRPFNYAKLGMSIGMLLTAATILKLSFNTLKPALYSRNLWAAISLILILLFTSGHMFNHIRHVPYVVNDGRGGISYIAGGFSNQFGLETQIVAVVYALLAFSTISLGMKMPTVEDPGKQKFAIIVWNVVLLVGFSFLISLFKQKNGSYPFFLPPLM